MIQAVPTLHVLVVRVTDGVGVEASVRERPPDGGAGNRLGLVFGVIGCQVLDVVAEDPVSREIQNDIREMLPPELMLDAEIPRDSAFLKASRAGVPVGLLNRQPPAASSSFDQLAAELEERINLAKSSTSEESDEYTRLMD